MPTNKADLILHPARMQILQALALNPMNTQELSDSLNNVPKSSIYRHIRALLEGGMIEIAEIRQVKGVQEKYYRLAQAPHLSQEDIAGFTQEQNLRYFSMFLASKLQEFTDYLKTHPNPDFQSDRVGYTEINMNVSNDEFDRLQTGLRQLLLEFAQNQPNAKRHQHKLAIITYPLSDGEKNHE